MTSLINPASKASAHVPAQPQQDRSIDVSKIAYQLPQPEGMISDTFVAAALDLDADERAWVPQSLNIAFRPLILNVSQGYDIISCAFALPECSRGIVTAARSMRSRCAAGGKPPPFRD
jgi:hypothetical protein